MSDDATIREALLARQPAVAAAEPDWADVLRRAHDPSDGQRQEVRELRLRHALGHCQLGPPTVEQRG